MTTWDNAPAIISNLEWAEHTGELARVSGEQGSLRGTIVELKAAINELGTTARNLSANVALLDGTVKELRADVRTGKRSIHKVEEWIEDSSVKDRVELERQLRDERRARRTWVKYAVGVAIVVAEAGILHWLHW